MPPEGDGGTSLILHVNKKKQVYVIDIGSHPSTKHRAGVENSMIVDKETLIVDYLVELVGFVIVVNVVKMAGCCVFRKCGENDGFTGPSSCGKNDGFGWVKVVKMAVVVVLNVVKMTG